MTPPNAGGAVESKRGRLVLLVPDEEYGGQLRRLGLLAATSVADLEGRDVAIVPFRPDATTPSAWTRASREAVAAECRARGHRTRLVELEPLRGAMLQGLSRRRNGGPASSTADSVDAFVETLPDWEPPQKPPSRVTPRRSAARREPKRFAITAPARLTLPTLAAPKRRGFTMLPNDFFEDECFRGFDADYCHGVTRILCAASFKRLLVYRDDGEDVWAPPGTLCLSYQEIADRARISKKRAQGLVSALLKSGWLVDIGSGLPKPLSRTSRRLLHIVRYAEYMGLPAAESQSEDPTPQPKRPRVVSSGTPSAETSAQVQALAPPPDATQRTPDDEARRGREMIRRGREAKELEFLRLVAVIADTEGSDASEVAKMMSGYERDGQKVRGVERPELLSDARLEKSLEDGRAWLAELQGPARP